MMDYFGYAGKCCVVTGASSGMGKATTEVLLDLGAKVIGLDVVENVLPGVQYIPMDVSDRQSIDKAFAQIPEKIDAFFAAAGVSGQKQSFELTFKINFMGNRYILDAYLGERMKEGGAIAIISSMAGARWKEYLDEYKAVADADDWDGMIAKIKELEPDKHTGIDGYVLSKRAIAYYALSHVKYWADKKVRINLLMPGSTHSAMTAAFIEAGMEDELLKTTGPAKRLAETREMAEPFVFLNSQMASFINGNTLTCDFGMDAMIKNGEIADEYAFNVI